MTDIDNLSTALCNHDKSSSKLLNVLTLIAYYNSGLHGIRIRLKGLKPFGQANRTAR